MEITHIKANLSLATVLQSYNLKPNKNNMLRCPFHEDSTASLQVSFSQNKYKCHGCDKKGDVIQFVQDYEKLTKHEALKKCAELAGSQKLEVGSIKPQTNQISNIQLPASDFLQKIFASFKNAAIRSQPAKDYLKSRNLDPKKLNNPPTYNGGIGYNGGQFHHGQRKEDSLIQNCLANGLLIDNNRKGNTGEIVYTVFGKYGIVFPLKNQENQIVSLYFRSTLDKEYAKHFYLKNRQGLYPNYPKPETKKLILTEAIIDAASLLQIDEITNNYSVLACYGTNGLNDEILKAIKNLQQLEEVIFFFDGDKPGNEAVKKYSQQLETLNLKLKISQVQTPDYEDVNSLIQGHEPEILLHFLEQRAAQKPSIVGDEAGAALRSLDQEKPKKLSTSSPQLPTIIDILKSENLLQKLNILIEQSGIIGEENSRLLLFIIASSYKTKQPLHAIVQGSSGSGKTHLISKIADLIPQEDVLRFTRITESSLYNWGEYELVNKLLIIEDLDGLKEEAMFAMRELISNQRLSSSVSIKDKKGNIKSVKKEVKGIFSSLSATTKGDLYEDNMSRSFLLAVDESAAQSRRIIDYQNKRYAGEIDQKTQEKAKNQLQQTVRNLKSYEVINPYATRLELPEEVHKIRRLNEMFQSIVKQITIINQQNRELKNDKLITQIEDLEQATEVLFESIILKVDELDGSLRQFFERLKKHLKTQEKDFTQREIRQAFNISKSQIHRYLQSLLELEYIRQIGGFANKGLKYKVDYWDDYGRLRIKIKDKLLLQIKVLKESNETLKEH
jgi:DNA primase catalytic core